MLFKEGGLLFFSMVGRRTKVLGLLCPRRPYIELFYVEQKVKIIINNTWNIPFFTFKEQKKNNCQLTFLKKTTLGVYTNFRGY